MVGGVYAIRNTAAGKLLLTSTNNLAGCQNRFVFSQKNNSCVNWQLQKDWEKYGGGGFVFEVLDELVKKETQTDEEFTADIKMLEEIWREKLKKADLY